MLIYVCVPAYACEATFKNEFFFHQSIKRGIMMSKEIIKDILEGNEGYHVDSSVLDSIKKGQSPTITLVTCSDSRVSGHIMNKDMVNQVFHVRNIGNQIENNYGSVDYGIHHLKTPILLILGHTDCGAIKASQSDFSKESDEIRSELYPLYFNLKESSKGLDVKETKNVTRLVQANVDKQVKLAMNRYGSTNTNFIGAVFDIHGHMSSQEGRIIITNINGITDIDRMRDHPLLSELDNSLRDAKVHRV